MNKSTRNFLAASAAISAMIFAPAVSANPIEEIHFLIPGGPGGGWDGTARGTGEALAKAGAVKSVSFENMSGGGGGKAIAHLIETADKAKTTLMVNSTPIVIRSLQGVFPQSFRDLTPVAGIIGDYAAFVVHKGSDLADFTALSNKYKADPKSVAIGGGSVAGGMDHLVAAMVMKAAGADPKAVKYIPYDAGGKAMAGLLSGEISALSTGFGEAIDLAKQGEVNILCVTAKERLAEAPDTPTCYEQGAAVEFVNWRGFFAAPGISDEKKAEYVAALEDMYETPEWETVRARNGWVNIFNGGEDFVDFLEYQEGEMKTLMTELGFL